MYSSPSLVTQWAPSVIRLNVVIVIFVDPLH